MSRPPRTLPGVDNQRLVRELTKECISSVYLKWSEHATICLFLKGFSALRKENRLNWHREFHDLNPERRNKIFEVQFSENRGTLCKVN